MLAYYVKVALISLRKNWVLSTLMVLAIGLGVGACMTVVTVNYIMASDPIPQKSSELYFVQLDNWDPNSPFNEPNEPPNQMTYLDSMALIRSGKTEGGALRQTASAALSFVLKPQQADNKPYVATGRATFADFFTMFDVPFLYGTGWSSSADEQRELVAVISRETNERVFGGIDSVGQNIELDARLYRVIGVLDTWQPVPKFYDLTTGPFNKIEEVYVPFHLVTELKLSRQGSTNCWKPSGDGFAAFLNSECVWTPILG